MNCPVCSVELRISDRQGVEIDYCPQCRGVWLDRGELDKIIERSSGYERERHYEERSYHDDDYEYGKKKKRSSFLGELFDF
jgi:Zn-finger nucleic acid-binding protein